MRAYGGGQFVQSLLNLAMAFSSGGCPRRGRERPPGHARRVLLVCRGCPGCGLLAFRGLPGRG
eukprot:3055524-Alexandrium_andersonii.AAC.1